MLRSVAGAGAGRRYLLYDSVGEGLEEQEGVVAALLLLLVLRIALDGR